MKKEELLKILYDKKEKCFIKTTESAYLNGFEEGVEAVVLEMIALLEKEEKEIENEKN